MPVRLVPKSSGKSIKLDKPVVLIGRNPECDVILRRSQKVSRTHCVLACVENRIFVRDLGSTNGVWVNGQRVERESRVRLGDELSIADVQYHVLNVDQDPPERNGDDSDDSPGRRASPRRAGIAPIEISGDRPVALPDEEDSFVVEPSIARLPRIRPDEAAPEHDPRPEDSEAPANDSDESELQSDDVVPIGPADTDGEDNWQPIPLDLGQESASDVPASSDDDAVSEDAEETPVVRLPADLSARLLKERGEPAAQPVSAPEIPLFSRDEIPTAEGNSDIHDAIPVAHAASEVEIPLLLEDEEEENLLLDDDEDESLPGDIDEEEGFPLLDEEDESDDIIPLAPIDED